MGDSIADISDPGADADADIGQGAPGDAAIMAHFLRKPGYLIARVDQISMAIYAGISAGETLTQAEFLLLLDALGCVSQAKLARAAGVDTSTTAYVLDNLQQRGWVRREMAARDRRLRLISLTTAGQKRIARIGDDHRQLQQLLIAPVPPDARGRLVAGLQPLAIGAGLHAPPWLPACHPDIGVLDGATSFLWRRMLQLLQGEFQTLTAAHQLTLRQFSLLFILSLRPAITQAHFARMFGLDPSTCGVIMRGLAARRLLQHCPSPVDRRARLYAITSRGRAVLHEVGPLADEAERLVFPAGAPIGQDWLIAQLLAIAHAHSHRLRMPGPIAVS